MGSIYKQRSRDGTAGRIWWVKYYANGRPVRESTGTEKEAEARRFLKEREGRVAAGQPILPRVDRIRYEEAAQDLRHYYQTTGARDIKEAETRLRHLDLFFAQRRFGTIETTLITKYVAKRQGDGAQNGTINRELATLSRMLKLAYENGKLVRLPVIHKPRENGPRQGFFEDDQYRALRRHLAPDLQAALAIAFAFGWRMQSEVLTLERRQLDLEAGTLRLETGTTKNDEGRLVYLPPDLKAQLAVQLERVRALERELGRIIPSLFPHLSGPYQGQRRRDFRRAWMTARRKAGLPGKLRHDLRRTAVRNMVNKGISERVAMTVTGHKTRAVFDRYHIVSPADLKEVARKLTGITAGITAGPSPDSQS